jgi:hypothetical protein
MDNHLAWLNKLLSLINAYRAMPYPAQSDQQLRALVAARMSITAHLQALFAHAIDQQPGSDTLSVPTMETEWAMQKLDAERWRFGVKHGFPECFLQERPTKGPAFWVRPDQDLEAADEYPSATEAMDAMRACLMAPDAGTSKP